MSTKPPIDPGEGYRLLGPGRTTMQHKHECIYAESHPAKHWGPVEGLHMAVVQEDWTAQHVGGDRYYIREPIPKTSEERWILVAQTPLPKSGRVIASLPDGSITIGRVEMIGDAVAWMPLPEPYVPPVPKKPKRRRGVIGVTKGCGAHWHSDIGLPEGVTIDVCEVLPGDVDPDAARKAREICEGIIAGSPTPNARTVAASDILRILNEKQT